MVREMLEKAEAIEAAVLPTYDEPVPDYADVMEVGRFRDACKSNCFIDYDGDGHPVKDGLMANMLIKPSKWESIPEDCTHVAWFNR